MNKKGQINIFAVLGIVLVGWLFLTNGGKNPLPWQTQTTGGTGDTGGTGGTGGNGGTGGTIQCPGISGVVMTIGPTEEKWATTSTSTEWSQLYLDGKDQGLKLDASTKSIAPGTKYDIWYGFNSSIYYSAKANGEAGCYDFRTADKDGERYKLYRADTAPTISIFNWNNGNLNTFADNVTLDSGVTKTLSVDISLTALRAISPYGKLIVMIEGNSTAYDSLSMPYSTTTCGDNANISVAATANRRQCYAIPYDTFKVSTDGTYETLKTSITVDVASGVNPTTGAGYIINGTIQDENYYQHTVSKEMLFGNENDKNTEVGFISAEFGIGVQ